ncbi:MAG: alpha-hydroxy-acid oxidizing protein [SAR202 cluster bacterium]|nr:alpha-hydroxy-acid oxidizing protein [SAR202 cluster bacterium]|tara:strand:- start:4130 stop:5218 length:1089 start_codon:yes stop_codon:yes gene_type:complete
MNSSHKHIPINLFDFEALAEAALSKSAYDYYASGSGDEITLVSNRIAFDKIELLPRVLVDVSQRNIQTTVLSTPVAAPILIAPTAFQRLAHPDGEISTARAAEKAGTIMTVSTLSNTTLEDVSSATQATLWFQLYVHKDRELTRSLIQRAETAGYKAICITVDTPLLGRRERDVRNRFGLPDHLEIANVKTHLNASEDNASALAIYATELLDQAITWKDIEWVRSITTLPVLLKGIHHPDDAVLAVKHGANGIIVSNHGARQLDTVPATIDMLPGITRAIDGQIEVLLDGGVRRGTDILKALALGASAILIGRPILWGLTVDGEQGVLRVLEMLREELDLAMALSGITSIDEVSKDLLFPTK